MRQPRTGPSRKLGGMSLTLTAFAFMLALCGPFASGSLLDAAYDLPANRLSAALVRAAQSWDGAMQALGIAKAGATARAVFARIADAEWQEPPALKMEATPVDDVPAGENVGDVSTSEEERLRGSHLRAGL